jgi:hypothetical protein
MCWDENSGSWREWDKTGNRSVLGTLVGVSSKQPIWDRGWGVHSSACPHFYGFQSPGIGVLLALGGYELAPV